jgi:hypothetical protein
VRFKLERLGEVVALCLGFGLLRCLLFCDVEERTELKGLEGPLYRQQEPSEDALGLGQTLLDGRS